METIEVRDRRSGFLWVPNAFFDTFAKTIQPSSWVVYLALARQANNSTQQCFPSYEWLAEVTGLARSTVGECLQELRTAGAIEWDRKGRHNVYTLLEMNSPKNGLVRETVRKPDTTSPIYPLDQSGGPDPNKTHNKTQEQDSLSSPNGSDDNFKLSEPIKPPSKGKKSTADPRHSRFMELIFRAHKHYVGIEPTILPATPKNLQRFLKASPGLDERRFVVMLKNYHESADHSRAASPHEYILRLPKYELGPLNKFGREEEAMGMGS